MNNQISNKLKFHPTFTHTAEIHEICKPLELLNITSFSNMRIADTSFVGLSSNPDFAKNYILKEHYKADVHVDLKHCHLTQCLMWDHLETQGAAEQMVKDASELNCKHIFTIIKINHDEVNYYNFGTHLDNRGINQVYVNHFDLLEKFIAHFHDNVSKSTELQKAYDISFDMSAQPISIKDTNLGTIDEHSITQFLHAIQKNTTLSKILTPAELRLIPFILHAHTAKEMGKTLGLSFRTVESYIDCIKHKLHARNKVDLVNKLIRLT